jgi:hypothetical protein
VTNVPFFACTMLVSVPRTSAITKLVIGNRIVWMDHSAPVDKLLGYHISIWTPFQIQIQTSEHNDQTTQTESFRSKYNGTCKRISLIG